MRLESRAFTVVTVVAAAIAGAGLVECGHHTADEVTPEPMIRSGDRIDIPAGSPLRARLVVAPAQSRDVRRALEAPAQVEADPSHLARITLPLPGRVLQLMVHFGDTVTRGTPLFTLDSPDLVAAQSDFLRARTTVTQNERVVHREQALLREGATSPREVEDAQAELDVSRTELERASVRLRLLHIDPGAVGRALTVNSPLDGRVIEFHVAAGEYHDADDQLMTIADLSTVWVTASVQERDIGRVHPGEDVTATLVAYPGERWTGQVLSVADLLDPTTRTIQVRTAFPNADRRLRPGMFARVTFTESAVAEVLVPTTAVILIGDTNYVFVETSPWVFVRRRVEPGEQSGDSIAILDGLRQGERVAVSNAVLLQ